MTLRENEASDEAWAKATRIGRELDRILDGQEPMRTAVARAASELRLSTRQVYNHLRRYRTERRVSSLLPRTGGARRARISPAVEKIIAATLRELWLRPEQPDLAPIVDEIRTRCVSEGLDPPAYVTVSKRIPRLFTPEEIARRRHSGGKNLGNTYRHCLIYNRLPEYYAKLDEDPNFMPAEKGVDNLMDMEGMAEHYEKLYDTHTREVIEYFAKNDPRRLLVCELSDNEKWLKMGVLRLSGESSVKGTVKKTYFTS